MNNARPNKQQVNLRLTTAEHQQLQVLGGLLGLNSSDTIRVAIIATQAMEICNPDAIDATVKRWLAGRPARP